MDPNRPIDLIAFDVDGTLVVHPSGKVMWQVLNEHFGRSAAQVAQRQADFLAGRIEYADWVRLDIGDWMAAGATRANLVDALGEFELRRGGRRLLEELRRRGYRLVAISGTLDILVETVFPDHPFEHLQSNRIFFRPDGHIDGWEPTPYDFDGKAVALRATCTRLGVPLSRTAFVGDDINDLDAAQAAALSVAVFPRSAELAAACHLIHQDGPLTRLLAHFV